MNSVAVARPAIRLQSLRLRVSGALAARVAVAAIAFVLYAWGLAANGYANAYYSAAALAASQSWTAWFFGSLDAGNFITVDKPPLSTMIIGLSVRIFGLSPWSILLPQALAGVATVVLLFSLVRRCFGTVAATIAGLAMTLTPVAVMMFRFNNPDALLTLLLVAAAACLVRGLERGAIRWAVAASVLVGFAFLTKYLQAYLVLPTFALTWLVSAPGSVRRRIAGLVAAAAAVLVSSGWWVAIVDAIPTTARPYIGGSTNNSALELLLGYDGLQRVFGFLGRAFGRDGGARMPNAPADGAAALSAGGFGGSPGLLRLVNGEFVGEISWLIPFALVALAAGLVMHARRPRTDAARASYLLWGGWLLVSAGVFSFMTGIIHPYYTVELAPAIAALVGAGTVDLWRLRSRSRAGGIVLAAALVATAAWGAYVLSLTPAFVPWLGATAIALSCAGAIALVVPARSAAWQRVAIVGAAVALLAALAPQTAYAIATAATPHAGSLPVSGPSPDAARRDGGRVELIAPDAQSGAPPFAIPPAGAQGGGPAANVPQALVDYLVANKGSATWIVAVNGAQEAASLELASREPVMAMGGFSGDPAPTLEQLQRYVREGKLRYVLVGGGGPAGFAGPGGRGTSSAIASWVRSNGTVVDLGSSAGGTLYDLSGAAG